MAQKTVGELFRSFFSEKEQERVAVRLHAGLITLQEISETVFFLQSIEDEDWPGLKGGAKNVLIGIDLP